MNKRLLSLILGMAALIAAMVADSLRADPPTASHEPVFTDTAQTLTHKNIDISQGSLSGVNYQGVFLMAGIVNGNASPGGEKLTIFKSFDGSAFELHAFSCYAGANGFTVRDPCLFWWAGKFWVLYTESAFNSGAFTMGSTFGLACSTDLKNWTWVADVSVAATVGGGNNYFTWQPQWFLDAAGSPHVLIGCSTPGSGLFPPSSGRIYELHPTDLTGLTTWSAPVATDLVNAVPQSVWYDPSTKLYNAEVYDVGGGGQKPFTNSTGFITGWTSSGSGAWTTLGTVDGVSICMTAPGNYTAIGTLQGSGHPNSIPISTTTNAGSTWSSGSISAKDYNVNSISLINPSLIYLANSSAAFQALNQSLRSDRIRRDIDDAIFSETVVLLPDYPITGGVNAFHTGNSGHYSAIDGGSGYPIIDLLSTDGVNAWGSYMLSKWAAVNGPIDFSHRLILRIDFTSGGISSTSGNNALRFFLGGVFDNSNDYKDLANQGIEVELTDQTHVRLKTFITGGTLQTSATWSLTRPGALAWQSLIIDSEVGNVFLYYKPDEGSPAQLIGSVTNGPTDNTGGSNQSITAALVNLTSSTGIEANCWVRGGQLRILQPLTVPAK